MSTKTFKDLIREVHEKGICQQCGGCVSFCSSAQYDVIGFSDPYSPPVYIHEDECLDCGICYYICPQTHVLDSDLNKNYNFTNFLSTPLGQIRNIYSCQALDEEFLKVGTDGGVVNSIINFLLESKQIEGAIVSKTTTPLSRKATLAKTKDELIQAAGTQLNVSSQLDEIQKYCSYTNTISELNHFKFNKLAIVGTPCQIYTIRCMQELGVTPSENIAVCLGLFCYENFLFDRSQLEKFQRDFNIRYDRIMKVNIKEDVIFKISDESEIKTIHVPFNHLNNFMRSACNACSDFTNIYADLSFGGLGSQNKYTTVIIRTEKGEKIINEALNEGIIMKLDLDVSKKQKTRDFLIDYSKKKIERRERFMNNLEA